MRGKCSNDVSKNVFLDYTFSSVIATDDHYNLLSPPFYSGATVQEHKAASRITRSFQQHIDTRRRKFLTPGTQGNKVAMVEIENSLSSLEPHLNSLAMEVLG